jgi:hypothetical protein
MALVSFLVCSRRLHYSPPPLVTPPVSAVSVNESCRRPHAVYGTSFIGGSGFLAVHIAGVTATGTTSFLHRTTFDAFTTASLSQIGMFLMLGLLLSAPATANHPPALIVAGV